MKAQRCALSLDERASAGEAVARFACAVPEFQQANRVAAYVALEDEMPTRAILDAVLASGRALLLPRLVAAGMEFAAVEDLASLRRGAFGVLEPAASSGALELGPSDLVFVPGVAFDRCGGRLGRGGGYYDRAFPPALAAPLLIGLAFSFQLVEVVPMGPSDRRVGLVVSESGIARVASSPRDPSRDSG
jgi:5-formyltetrahydrofolate cyclo-ligase